VPRIDAEARELGTDDRDVDVRLGVALLRAAPDRREQPELLELLRELGGHARTLAELVELDRLRPLAEADRSPPLAFARPGNRQFVADHAQRKELVALEAQDRHQALDVLLAEEPVAAAGPLRAEQALVLEEADLGDRDVRELLAQAAHDLADAEGALAPRGVCRRAHRSTKIILYLPIWSSSPPSRRVLSMRRRLTNVPFSDPWSSAKKLPSRSTRMA